MEKVMTILDDNKASIPEGIYLQLCQEIKRVHETEEKYENLCEVSYLKPSFVVDFDDPDGYHITYSSRKELVFLDKKDRERYNTYLARSKYVHFDGSNMVLGNGADRNNQELKMNMKRCECEEYCPTINVDLGILVIDIKKAKEEENDEDDE